MTQIEQPVAESGTPETAAVERFGSLIERNDGVDFPYYNGAPAPFTAWQWLLLWGAVAIGFIVLIFTPQPNNLVSLIPRSLFVAVPLGALALATQKHWTALFRRVRGRDVLLMVVFAILNLVVSFALGFIINALFGANANPAGGRLANAGALDIVVFFFGAGIQIVGEEIFTILPFLALLYFFVVKGRLSRKQAVLLAWVITALWFGGAHLPTYGWNFAQAFIIIGGARIVLTLAYIRTKNLWVSSGAHILNDWVMFTAPLVVAAISG